MNLSFLLNQNYYCDIILTIKLLTIYSEKIWISNEKNKMTKDTIPEGFSVPLAVFDLIPVIFFGLSAIRE